MKYYKNSNNEIYAFDDEKKAKDDIQRLRLISIGEADLKELLNSPEAERLAEIEVEIAECENYIRHALIIGNNAVLENLRAEYKELIAERERLNTTSEPTTVAPTDHL
nr:MAG TPA: hypothetical protein [Caudoviricetes sp.]